MRFSDLRVGNTPQIEIPQLSGRYGCRIIVKDESANPFGTFKDRRNCWLVYRDREEQCPIYYVQITSGNSGLSLARMCDAFYYETDRHRYAINLVDRNLDSSIKRSLRKQKHSIVEEIDLSREPVYNHQLIDIGSAIAGKNLPVRLVEQEGSNGDGYGKIAEELMEKLQLIDYVFVPVGEGELMTKLCLAFAQPSYIVQRAPGEIVARLNPAAGIKPRIVGATVYENVFCHDGFIQNIGTSVADKLVTPYSDFYARLTDLCERYGHEILSVSDDQIREELGVLRDMKLRAEPSAAAAFAGAHKYKKNLNPDSVVVVINTGDGNLAAYGKRTGSRFSRHAQLTVAALTCMGMTAVSDSFTHEALKQRQLDKIHEETEIQMRQYELDQLAGNPQMNDIIAYALWRGNGVVDERIRDNLVTYYINPDNWWMMKDLYREGTRARQGVDGFQKWLEDQKTRREEESRRIAQAYTEYYARQDSIRNAENANKK